jgi:hypothetical protein
VLAENGLLTLKIFGCKDDGTEMMVLDQAANLGGHLGPIPAHDEHLPNGPTFRMLSALRHSAAMKCKPSEASRH